MLPHQRPARKAQKGYFYMKYSTKEKEKKVFAIIVVIVMLLAIAVLAAEALGVLDKPAWDVSYTMANQHIELRGGMIL